ncbi:LPXTG-motif cell wall-anchored protein [Streptococcus rupicaprae]|uniref:LPXTG-motif cell wall-anchored protein n=1 Tax=Streptococcus rupicaprae TaxID=759619 RepID=A0ABV2FEP7_9STRE
MEKGKFSKKIVGLSASFLLALMAEGVINPVVHADDLDPNATVSVVDGSGGELVPAPQEEPVADTEALLAPSASTSATAGAEPTSGTVEHSQPSIPETAVETSGEQPVATDQSAPQPVAATALRNASTPSAEAPIVLDEQEVYMSEKARLEITLDTSETSLNWSIPALPKNTYVHRSHLANGDPRRNDPSYLANPYIGPELVTVAEESSDGSVYKANIDLEALFGEDLSLRSTTNIRRTYRDFIGSYTLEGRNAAGDLIASKLLHLKPYPSYETYEEMVAATDGAAQNHAPDRYATIETIGTSAEGRPIRMGIVAEKAQDLTDYLERISPVMLKNPEALLKQLQSGNLTYKVPIMIHNTHADEQPGIDVVSKLFQNFTQQDEFRFVTTDGQGQSQSITLPVKDLLKQAFFLFNFTENPDGAVHNFRGLPNGLDINRDAGFQTSPEAKAAVAQITKWNPLALYDIHGFVKEFLIEPATPPHDPNFEYDLLSDSMLEHAHHMGRAGVANSKYKETNPDKGYIIPKIDWGEGWDDAFSGYTAVYSMHHAVLGHTLEIPEMNEESFKAGYYAVLGGIRYVLDQKDQLMANRLNYYARGINKIEDPKANDQLVAPDGSVVGRPKEGRETFFPDYYVIPMGLAKNRDSQEAFDMISYFRRNGIEVGELLVDRGEFKAGDLIIDMAQAKRGYANHVLYKGSDESAWSDMYAEVVMNRPVMRGFEAIPIFEADYFKHILGPVSHKEAPRTVVDPKASYYVVHNNSLSAIQAVNAVLQNGGRVYLTDDGYIMSTKDFSNALDTYALYGTPIYNKKPVGESLKPMKVYAPGNPNIGLSIPSKSEVYQASKQMGFKMVENLEDADVVVLDSNQFSADDLGKKPTIIIGGDAMHRLEELGLIPGFDAERTGRSHEGLLKALLDSTHVLTSGYLPNDYFYSNSGSWINTLPENFKQLLKVADGDYFVAGWWPGHEKVADKLLAIDGVYGDQPIFIFAGDPVNKLNSIYFYRWVSNAIFRGEVANLLAYEPNRGIIEFPKSPPAKEPEVVQVVNAGSHQKASVPVTYLTQEADDLKLASLGESPHKENALPKTGNASSRFLTLIGAMISAILAGLHFKKNRQKD